MYVPLRKYGGMVVPTPTSKMAVPHIGWNGRVHHQDSPAFKYVNNEEEVYFVHSYQAPIIKENEEDKSFDLAKKDQNQLK